MRPLIPRVLSCQRHGWPSISTWRCRQALAAYPKASDEQSSNAFCLALLPMRLAMRLLLPVARWSLAPPFHPYRPEGRRSVLCCAISQVTLGGRYLPTCSVEPGSSSATKWPRPSRGLASDCSKGCDCLQWWLEEAPCDETGALVRHMHLRREQSVPTRGKRRRFFNK